MGHNCMALSLQTDAPRPLQGAGAMLDVVPWLMTRAYKRLTLEEEPQRATEDGLGLRTCSTRAPGWR